MTNSTDNDSRGDANRRNAQFSTGPRSEAGKARSSQNAIRSGWFARDFRVAEGKEEQYLEFEQAWRDELQPEGLLELEAFSDFLRALWRKREVIEAQNQFAASSPATFLDQDSARQFDRLMRYERDFERRSNQAIRELRRLQTDRAAKTNPTVAAGPPLASAEVLRQKRTHQRQEPPGSLIEDLLASVVLQDMGRNRDNKDEGVADPEPAPSVS